MRSFKTFKTNKFCLFYSSKSYILQSHTFFRDIHSSETYILQRHTFFRDIHSRVILFGLYFLFKLIFDLLYIISFYLLNKSNIYYQITFSYFITIRAQRVTNIPSFRGCPTITFGNKKSFFFDLKVLFAFLAPFYYYQ